MLHYYLSHWPHFIKKDIHSDLTFVSSESQKREREGAENVLKEIIAQNSPNLANI